MKARWETMPWKKKEQYLNRKLRWLVRFAYDNAPSIKKRLDATGISPGDIRSIKDLLKLRSICKEDLLRYERENPAFWEGF